MRRSSSHGPLRQTSTRVSVTTVPTAPPDFVAVESTKVSLSAREVPDGTYSDLSRTIERAHAEVHRWKSKSRHSERRLSDAIVLNERLQGTVTTLDRDLASTKGELSHAQTNAAANAVAGCSKRTARAAVEKANALEAELAIIQEHGDNRDTALEEARKRNTTLEAHL